MLVEITTLKNHTPHPLNIYTPDTPDVLSDPGQGLLRTIAVSGPAARLTMDEQGNPSAVDGIPTQDVLYGQDTSLPPEEPGVGIIVSLVSGLASARERGDIFVPYREVRNSAGTVIGCRALARPRTQ
ncbi:hypothetical protein [Streptomyces lydicus]|uniref:hypothetical protein n=1 Tax=Streptomyces lydicus TaxID=47763 RepID=UPI001012A0DE|nr:hypothetical protein [Streptomyces lydicus]MCZ1012023.1 hypothetical protein [Streptomyces lydicus]